MSCCRARRIAPPASPAFNSSVPDALCVLHLLPACRHRCQPACQPACQVLPEVQAVLADDPATGNSTRPMLWAATVAHFVFVPL